jgi:replicative DNA helicase Mcm
MKKTLWDLIKLLFPLRSEKKQAFDMATPYLTEHELRALRQYLKLDRTFPVIQKFHTSPDVFADKEWAFFKSHLHDEDLQKFLTTINTTIAEKAKQEAFIAFAPGALDKISVCIAPNIVGMEETKQAAALQLFAKEPVHLLLIGDPGTGKTDILRSVHQLAPISSFGLGSGTSGAGLGAMAKGEEIMKGILPLADRGIACIDELNLMKAKDMAALYNAMEKGFITYDKGGKHEQLPARVRVCATANPSGDTFIGKSTEAVRKQIPFEDALLSRFHFVFIVRKPTAEEFGEITQRIVTGKKKAVTKEDVAFIKEYVTQAHELEVTIDPRFEQEIVEFIKGLKKDEKQFLMEVSARTVVGIVRIVKAIAVAEHATSVDEAHVKRACALVRKALYVRQAR